MFGIGYEEGWKTAGMGPGKWWEIVIEGVANVWLYGGRRKREQLNSAESRERPDEIPMVPGVTAGHLRNHYNRDIPFIQSVRNENCMRYTIKILDLLTLQ